MTIKDRQAIDLELKKLEPYIKGIKLGLEFNREFNPQLKKLMKENSILPSTFGTSIENHYLLENKFYHFNQALGIKVSNLLVDQLRYSKESILFRSIVHTHLLPSFKERVKNFCFEVFEGKTQMPMSLLKLFDSEKNPELVLFKIILIALSDGQRKSLHDSSLFTMGLLRTSLANSIISYL
jgi:hypothetical protein